MSARHLALAALLTSALGLQTAESAEPPRPNPDPFGYSGHEHDAETGLIYMKGRYYDPTTGRFLSRDPHPGYVEVPPSLHRYLYAYANPTVYVDPNGREVRAVDELALERIRSTLPEAIRDQIVTDPQTGLMSREAVNRVESEHPNFLALRELVSLEAVTAVKTAPSATYLDEQGQEQVEPFTYTSKEKTVADLNAARQAASMPPLTPEVIAELPNEPEPFLGITLTPLERQQPYDTDTGRTPGNEVLVVVSDDSTGAPALQYAKTTAHELYGHGLLYQRNEPFLHEAEGATTPGVAKSVFTEIEARTGPMLTVEDPKGNGVRSVPLRPPPPPLPPRREKQ